MNSYYNSYDGEQMVPGYTAPHVTVRHGRHLAHPHHQHQQYQQQQQHYQDYYAQHATHHSAPQVACSAAGSLGTPNIGRYWAHSPYQGSPLSSGGGTPNQNVTYPSQNAHITLVPTRPLLKALAKVSKPQPPWCVGSSQPASALSLTDELAYFSTFVALTAEEQLMHNNALTVMTEVFSVAYSMPVQLLPMGSTAAGQPATKTVTGHYYVQDTESEGTPKVMNEASDDFRQALLQAANDRGTQIEFGSDDREIPCVVMTHSASGRRFCVRYGDKVSLVEASTAILLKDIAQYPAMLATFVALSALLSQNQILDNIGTSKGKLSAEALAVMLLAVRNSYEADDVPDAGRLLLDFFLTFGFESCFNAGTHSISYEGMPSAPAKVHTNTQLSVLDPGTLKLNLTSGLDRVANLQAVFNYCYTALQQYQQVSPLQRRAQSPLSTILGGEPFWGRVLLLHEHMVQPFYSFIQGKRDYLERSL